MTLLAVDHLRIRLHQPPQRVLVDGVSFHIDKGEMLALVGESGSGKSLTALSIMQLLGKTFDAEGSVRLQGVEMMTASEKELQRLRGNRVSMIFQEPMTALNPLHTIGRQLEEMVRIHAASYEMRRGHVESQGIGRDPVPPLDAAHRIAELLDQVGLAHFKDRLDAYPHQLSGGERQRVMIAMAIANRPDLLICDEPTTAVDVTIQAKILELLKNLQRDMKMSMLFITHDLTLVHKLADRVAVMKGGALVEIGKVQDVFANPQAEYTRMLLGSAPKGHAVALPKTPETVVAATQLSVKFPIKRGVFQRTVGHTVAVDSVSMQIGKGETLGVVGESGSGKTTLAFGLLRLLKTEGQVVFLGRDITAVRGHSLRDLRSTMQLVFQDPYSSLNPRMTVGDIISEGLRAHPASQSEHEIIARVHHTLEEVGLTPDMADRYPHEFSGGQRQRISIARAMILKPKLVILDEPTSALDLTVQSQILTLLKTFQTSHGLSYMFISHDLRVIRAIAHRILVMKHGQIVEEGDAETLYTEPKTDYTRELMKAAYLL